VLAVLVVLLDVVVIRRATALTCCPWFSPAVGDVWATADTASPWPSASVLAVDATLEVDVRTLWAAELTASPCASPCSAVERAMVETMTPSPCGGSAASRVAGDDADTVEVVVNVLEMVSLSVSEA
jgi:hypothetical protein